MSKEPGFFEQFISDVKKGYDKQDAAIRDEKERAGSESRGIEGTLTGAVEGLLNPIRWISNIFR